MPYRAIETGGARLRLAESGAGEPAFVFLHYWGGSALTWQGVIRRLEGHVRCVALDQRGWDAMLASYGSREGVLQALAVLAARRCPTCFTSRSSRTRCAACRTPSGPGHSTT
jgi:pimeloyl-ACP methyl ester carboxylesterase